MFAQLRDVCSHHVHAYRRTYEVGHCVYFALVSIHGAYHFAAVGLLVLTVYGLLMVKEAP